MSTETITVRSDGGVRWFTLNRPDALNAWTPELASELLADLDAAEADPSVRVVVLTGAGRAFSAGADLKAGVFVDDSGRIDVRTPLRELFHPLVLRVRTMRVPVIAAVNGGAAGIGCSLALAADLIVAADSAYFMFAFSRIGLALDGGASILLSGRVGHGRATEMALLGDRLPASSALEWGLVNRVVPDAELRDTAAALAARLASGPPRAYATIKRELNEAAFPRLAEAMDAEAERQQELAQTADFVEGVTAFTEKRTPRFTGA